MAKKATLKAGEYQVRFKSLDCPGSRWYYCPFIYNDLNWAKGDMDNEFFPEIDFEEETKDDFEVIVELLDCSGETVYTTVVCK